MYAYGKGSDEKHSVLSESRIHRLLRNDRDSCLRDPVERFTAPDDAQGVLRLMA